MRNSVLKAGVMALAVVAIYVGAGTRARADFVSPIDLSTPGVVGDATGFNNSDKWNGNGPGDPATELAIAQELLNMTGLGQTFDNRAGLTTSVPLSKYMTSTVFDYAGTVNSSTINTGTSDVPVGWNYAIAKYDGPNAGYVLFYLGGKATTLPQYPNTLFGSYGISGFTAFNPVPEPTTVIAGAGALALVVLGIGIQSKRSGVIRIGK